MPARLKVIALISTLFFVTSKIQAAGLVVWPSSVALSAGQGTQFSAAAAGGSLVTWSLTPAVGIVKNGYYQAPNVITKPQTVVLIATGLAQMGNAVITLMPGGSPSAQIPTAQSPVTQGSPTPGPLAQSSSTPGTLTQGSTTQGSLTQSSVGPGLISLSLSPTFASLSASQSMSFAVLANGISSKLPVIWSIAPPVGTIANGIYQAPGTILSSQTVTVKATTLSSPSLTASASISLAGNQSRAATQGSVSITPTSASLTAGKGASFSAIVTGESSTAVSWSLSPAVGTVTNGYYLAPASITASQTVKLTATSLADPTKSASVSISLTASSASSGTSQGTPQVTPSSISLKPGQSAQFNFSVGGSASAASWSLVPNIGSVTNGYYTAPAAVSVPTSVTLIATSVANSSLTASAAIAIQSNRSSVTISVSPSSASLSSGQVAHFAATVTGSSNTAVTWSLSPAIGSLSGGAYTAPSVVTAQQAITVSAVSAADPTKSASATVTLVPVAVSLSPSTISLAAGKSAQFTATVTGASNSSVTWSLNPPVGSVANGLYQAPASISSSQTVSITAASVADATKTAHADDIADGQRRRHAQCKSGAHLARSFPNATVFGALVWGPRGWGTGERAMVDKPSGREHHVSGLVQRAEFCVQPAKHQGYRDQRGRNGIGHGDFDAGAVVSSLPPSCFRWKSSGRMARRRERPSLCRLTRM